ncbi:MAG: zf-HC2 domain-containing protein [Candidatus Fervidibacter sp.]|uniref:zf-HC2 domain-containing protein n=1 Tax=Candidatus Fervidibacter sp. TaxID=3100871 RepID=UPI00404B405D
MRCEQARELMSLLLDELITTEQKSELERHLRECVGCRAEWKLLRTVQKLLATTQPAPLPYDLVPLIMERVRAIEREKARKYSWSDLFRTRWRWLAVATASIVLTLSILGVRILKAKPEPPEAIYWSTHVIGATKAAVAPELMPISVTLSSLPLVGEKQ